MTVFVEGLLLEASIFLLATLVVLLCASIGMIGLAGIVKWAVLSGEVWIPEEQGVDDGKGGVLDSPWLFSAAEKHLSVVVPAYNEEKRLPAMLDEALAYLERRRKFDERFTYEVLVVDDGSSDGTSDVVRRYAAKHGNDTIRLLRLLRNCGKGGAVRRGMFFARGTYLLMADADGATRFSDLEVLMSKLQEKEELGLGMAVGSRAHLVSDDAVAQRSFLRNVLMRGFHVLVYTLCEREVRDTQCGFKLFTRETARLLFPSLNIERWAFDLELLFLARSFNVPVVEVGVNWHEIDGSKLNPLAASVQMLRDMLRIRAMYVLGWWRVNRGVVKDYERYMRKKNKKME